MYCNLPAIHNVSFAGFTSYFLMRSTDCQLIKKQPVINGCWVQKVPVKIIPKLNNSRGVKPKPPKIWPYLVVEFKVAILQNFVAFSEYMNFNISIILLFRTRIFVKTHNVHSAVRATCTFYCALQNRACHCVSWLTVVSKLVTLLSDPLALPWILISRPSELRGTEGLGGLMSF